MLTERLLAAQNPLSQADRPHQLFADAPAPPQSAAPPTAPVAPPPPPPGGAAPGMPGMPGMPTPPGQSK